MKEELTSSILALRTNSDFKNLLDELLSQRQDTLNKMLKADFSDPQYAQKQAFNQGTVVGIDKLFILLGNAESTPNSTFSLKKLFR